MVKSTEKSSFVDDSLFVRIDIRWGVAYICITFVYHGRLHSCSCVEHVMSLLLYMVEGGVDFGHGEYTIGQ